MKETISSLIAAWLVILCLMVLAAWKLLEIASWFWQHVRWVP